jgi:DNA-directed RNA polymerase subunit RPC12/RpoP
MPEIAGYICKVCKNEFVIEILSDREVVRQHREGQSTSPVRCPQCASQSLVRRK